MNTFLSTTLNKTVAEIFCGDDRVRPHMEPVIFEIHVNDTAAEISQRVAYANIRNLTDFAEEEEILFSVGAVFRILSVAQDLNDSNKTWHIKLELTVEKDLEPLHTYFGELISVEVNINLTILGKFFRLMGDFNRALRYYDMLIQQLSSDNEQLPLIYNNLGATWCGKGDWHQALMCYDQAKNLLESMPTVPNKEHTLTLIYQGFAGVYQVIHQWELGVCYGLKCLNLQSQCLPEKHPQIADTCLTLGWCYARLGEYKSASEMYHRALDIQMSTLPQYHPQIATTLNNLAGLYKDTKDYEIALEYYRKAYEISSLISPDGCGVATIYNNLGRLYAKMKHYPLSINYYEKCIELRERLELFNHPDLCESLYSLASLYMTLTRLTEARYYYEKLSNNLLNNEEMNYYWEAYKQIGLCYYLQQQYDNAIKNYLIALGRYNDRCHEKGAIMGIYNYLAWCYFHTKKYYTSYIIFKLALLSAKKLPKASNEFEDFGHNFHVRNLQNNIRKTKVLMMENNQYPLEPALRL
ncbi:unnamed protein product [Rotaria sp. Silwood1]|nr:unnamed protein product [Rotaria sp. Silwood1]